MLAFERQISVDDHQFLRSHVMNGRAVLPASMVIEWLAHGALHGQPGLRFQGFDEFRVLKGVRVNGETVALRVETSTPEEFGDNGSSRLILPSRLVSVDALGQTVLHARARIVLGAKLPGAPSPMPAPPVEDWTSKIDVYRDYLFHGPAFEVLRRIEGCGDSGIVATARASEPPHSWMSNPMRSHWLADPLVVDAGFQMLIVWSQETRGLGSLPAFIDSYRQFVKSFPREDVRIRATIVSRHEHRATADLEWLAADGSVIARMSGYECVIDGSLNKAFALNELSAGSEDQRA